MVGAVVLVGIDEAVVGRQHTVTTQVAVDASQPGLEQARDVIGGEPGQLAPDELVGALAVCAVEEDDVQVWVGPQVRRCALHHRDSARLRVVADA